MTKLFSLHKLINSIIILSVLLLPTCIFAANDEYSSELLNQSNKNNAAGFKLIKTREWPSSGCLMVTGKPIVNPGESTMLKIKKDDTKCEDSGVGYEIYSVADTKKEHLLGYLSHRLGAGKFSVQISRFCKSEKCVFTDLNPAQDR